jgi:Tfp pilus assembly protein PilV
MKTQPNSESGLTILEVLVASVLMAVGILGLLAIFPQALGSARDSGRRMVLNQLASQKLEELRSLGYTDADLTLGVHPAQSTDSDGQNYYAITSMPEDYSMRWTVAAGPTDGSGSAEANMKTVTVEAAYRVRYTAGGDPIPRTGSYANVFRTFITE